jgi:hypothetical protein
MPGVMTVLAGSGSENLVNGQGTNAAFSGPFGLALTTDGIVYVADVYNFNIRKISATGRIWKHVSISLLCHYMLL